MSNEIKVNWDLAPPDAIGMAQRGVDLAFVDNKGNIYLDNHWGISMGWRLVVTRPQSEQSKKKRIIELSEAEVQSGLDRVRWAEGLIKQLPSGHGGRNSWLLNYGESGVESHLKKTVEDVIKEFPEWPHKKAAVCVYDTKVKVFRFWMDNYRPEEECYEVCTREQYEAYTGAIKIGKILDSRDKQEHEAAKAEKWTHTHGGGLKCRVVAVDGEYSWVADEYGRRVTEYNSSLKPIKPTITESDLWRMANMAAFKEWKVKDFIAHVHEDFEVAGNE